MSSGLRARNDGIAEQFAASLSRSLVKQPESVNAILDLYGIKKEDSSDEAFHKIVAVLTDVGFYAPTTIALKGWPNASGRYLYHFNAANPFPGPLQGQASHILDVAYLFQNYNQDLSVADVAVAQEFGSAIIRFTKEGTTGWNPWSEQEPENYQVFGQTSETATFGVEKRAQRRPYISQMLEKYPYDLIWAALQNFLGGH
jgi:carboxylesterase type B